MDDLYSSMAVVGYVLWSADIRFADGHLGQISYAHRADSRHQAIADAKRWLHDHSVTRDWYFLNPSCSIYINGKNLFDGSPRHG